MYIVYPTSLFITSESGPNQALPHHSLVQCGLVACGTVASEYNFLQWFCLPKCACLA